MDLFFGASRAGDMQKVRWPRDAPGYERAAGPSRAGPMGPIPVGAAVHTGIAYVGTTGPEGAVTDFRRARRSPSTQRRGWLRLLPQGELLVTSDAAAGARLGSIKYR